jgi:hypothetical protein
LEQDIRSCILRVVTEVTAYEDSDADENEDREKGSQAQTISKLAEMAAQVANLHGSADEELGQARRAICEKAEKLDTARRLSAAVAMASQLAKAISDDAVSVPNIEAAVQAANNCKGLTLTGEAQKEATEAMVTVMETVREDIEDPSTFDSNADKCRLLVDFGISMSLLVPSTDAGTDSGAQAPATLAAQFIVQRRAVDLLDALSRLKEKPGKESATTASDAFKDLKSMIAALPDASLQASCKTLITKAQEAVAAAFQEQVTAAAGKLRTVIGSLSATKGGVGNGQSWKAGLSTATATWDEVAARGKVTLLEMNATELVKRFRSLKQAVVLITHKEQTQAFTHFWIYSRKVVRSNDVGS